MHKIDKIYWVMRGVRIYLSALEERLVDLQDSEIADPFNPSEELLSKLNDISDAIEEANQYLIGASDED